MKMIVDDDLIAKYLSGEASPEEAMAIMDWLESRENKLRFNELESTWNAANPSKNFKAINKEQAWRNIKPARSMWATVGIAASIAAVLVVAVFIVLKPTTEAQLSVSTIDSTKNVTLADQSAITLYHNSSIEFPEKFTKTREVKLISGEAFFSVQKDDTKPFIVHASFADIKVVGTQFNVIMRDGRVEVGVNEGLVLLMSGGDSTYIRKGSSVVVKQGQSAQASEIDVNKWAYATQRLVFKDTPLEEVVEAVEKTYSCKISVSNDDIKKCRLTAVFEKDSVDKILNLISEVLNLKLEQNGKNFTLEGEGCP